MLKVELIQLINMIIAEGCKEQRIELKDASICMPTRLYETISSFSNQVGGGIIIFGVYKFKEYEVTGVYDAEDLKRNVIEQSLQMEPEVRPFFTTAQINEKTIISAEIPECSTYEKPCYYKGYGKIRGSFIRIGDSDVAITEYEIYSYECYKRKTYDELRTVYRASLEDFSKHNITDYLNKLRTEKQFLINLDDNKILETHGVVQDGSPTLAGLILLGEYPQKHFPHLYINILVDKGDEQEKFSKRIEGTILQMLQGTLEFISRNINSKYSVNRDSLSYVNLEYPLVAVREIILNALIHRDYSVYTDHLPISIRLFKDRMEIDNPGGMYGNFNGEFFLNDNVGIRNPFISSAINILINTTNNFSGISSAKNILKAKEMPDPMFLIKEGMFKVILYRHIDNEGLDVNLEQEIIKFCIIPRSKEELAGKFGFLTPSYFIKTYLQSLIDKDKIKLTVPEKPQSKFQRYYA